MASKAVSKIPADIIRYRAGTGGRSSVSGVVATVFGAYGFLGRYVVNRLGRIGTQVIVAYRGDPYETRHLKLMGDLGQIQMAKYDPDDPESISRLMERSTVCINLVGKQFETFKSSYERSNADVPVAIAEAAKQMDVMRFVHVSALAADSKSPSRWARAKALGEEGVRAAFPSAAIIRPAHMFGDEDRLFNRLALMAKFTNRILLVGEGQARLQPVWVSDVAEAVAAAALSDDCRGKVYNLGGPEIWRVREIIDFVKTHIQREDVHVTELPAFMGELLGRVGEFVPQPLFTRDDYRLMQQDVVVPSTGLTAADLGIKPLPLREKAEQILVKFRSGSPYIAIHGKDEL